MYHFDWPVFFQYIWPPSAFQDPLIRNGLIATVIVSIVAQALGVILGLFAALGKMSKLAILRWISDIYIWYFRGTPLLVQMALLFFGLGVTHIYNFPDIVIGAIVITGAIQAGTLAVGINEGAYMSEIVRAGILAVDPGQTEAAKSLGMTYGQTMRRIVLPQAARVIIPPLGNEFNNMLKTTSLLTVISVFELYKTFSVAQGTSYATFELFAACAVWYLLLTTIWGFIQSRIEKRLERGTTRNTDNDMGLRARMWGLRNNAGNQGH